MTFDPHFRWYADGRPPVRGNPPDSFWPDLRAELVDELQRRRATYPGLVLKGRLAAALADRELRAWAAIARSVGAALGDDAAAVPATWAEMVHSLRREIALRRKMYPLWVDQGRVDAHEAARRLDLVETWHDLLWHECGGTAGEAARRERDRLLDQPRAA